MLEAHFTIAALVVAPLFVGCSSSSSPSTTDAGSDSGKGVAAQVQTDCATFCDAIAAKATGCSSSAAANCKGLCAFYTGVSSQDCADKLSAMWKCQQGQSWSCSGGGDVPSSTDTTCTAQETAADSACAAKDAGAKD